MEFISQPIPATKRVALVAHDNRKGALIEWCSRHRELLQRHRLVGTGTTGSKIEAATGLQVEKLLSGPMGGDQQLGARICQGEVDLLIFFWDPFEPMPHDPDVKALLRIAAVWNIPVACNGASADMMVQSVLMEREFEREVPDYQGYLAGR
ncbi:methylglyoxal synthase [Microbulbifer thermotolerans]|uniref:Methylglyoxal synthase n=1 Tax=Microbulbifer thermotolerans TaxID=252514 RepID=A0A143HJJ7_MICTH|nr:methylglyoxal synthase [Microbulbifer thermotolerans]AMX01676.1 methylglyoxal synthase [Microbulbifer thermotolerans]MCX2779444.1 methylglyoxal synthase [Microbulbifer thermotolerans]MCX2784044.1 methylglyoxal synthase [Microbulbifer thermotolerans]MCX2793315.1 methylglyoxal synthase [Microbulbifer thermotolerans]MCX2801253.1 methylglyoxal synthase [Microbulbifer thermotolerans]